MELWFLGTPTNYGGDLIRINQQSRANSNDFLTYQITLGDIHGIVVYCNLGLPS